MKYNSIILISAATCVAFTSCKDDQESPLPAVDYTAQITNTAENVILATYEDLSLKSLDLLTAASALQSNQSEADLSATRAAWIMTRSPWEQSEGFLFGPVDQEGLDPSMDSWPVNVTDLENVLSSSNVLTIDFLAQQEGTLKGFHTIEFLLWGSNGQKALADFTDREFEYLLAATGALAQDAETLFDLWNPSGGNYISNILTAGQGSQVYISQKSALEEMTNSLIVIADEVGNGKINDPLVQQDLTLEESRFSANSKADFADNMRSIRNIYTGYFALGGNGKSLSEIVISKDAALDLSVKQAIENAISAIETIPGTFSEAVFANPASVESAQNAVRDLQEILEEQVLPLISNL